MSEGLTGNLAQLPLEQLLTMLTLTNQSGRVAVESGDEPVIGEIYLDGGLVVHVTLAEETGVRALGAILAWQTGIFRFDTTALSAVRSVTGTLDEIITVAKAYQDELEEIARLMPAPEACPALVRTPPAEPILIEPREWRLLALLNGHTCFEDLPDLLGETAADVARELHGLVERGLATMDGFQPAQPTVGFIAPLFPAGMVANDHSPVIRRDFFLALGDALSAAIGPIASIVIEDTLENLGETRDTLPRDRASALVEQVAREIRDDSRRAVFQRVMLSELRRAA